MLCQAAAPPLTNLFVDTAAAAAAAIQTVAQQPAAFMAPADSSRPAAATGLCPGAQARSGDTDTLSHPQLLIIIVMLS